LHDELPFSFRVDAEDAPEGDVDAPQVAFAVERGSLEEAVDLRASAIRVGPGGPPFLSEFPWKRSKSARFDALYFLERIEQGGLAKGAEA
jgi:ferric-dicitrate binding protein FerR (iron transport regulator)